MIRYDKIILIIPYPASPLLSSLQFLGEDLDPLSLNLPLAPLEKWWRPAVAATSLQFQSSCHLEHFKVR